MDFNGCTALITGKNNSGKSSFLRGLIDRIRFIRPQIMVKQGEKEGKGELILDSGERFIWEFDDIKKDKLTYITDHGRQSVTKELGEQFFKPSFDIDKFLQSSPKNQVKQLQQIVGIDFEDIDKRFMVAYNFRTERNREAELYHVKLEKMIKCDKVEKVDLTELIAKKEVEKNRLNALYLKNKKANEKLRTEWSKVKSEIDFQVSQHNGLQTERRLMYNACNDSFATLKKYGYGGNEVTVFVKALADIIEDDKFAFNLYPKEPTYIDEMPDRSNLDKIDSEILSANDINAKAQKYREYIDHKNATEAAKDSAEAADLAVKVIEEERKKMIESANFPDGISITSDGILVDGFALDRNQLSTSKLYTAALRIAAMSLGEVKTLYFDASFLDKNSLAEIEKWANENDLQLLIERPDFQGGEISYEIIETI